MAIESDAKQKLWGYRFRNQFGEVFALVERKEEHIAVGFAFGNPLDFNEPHHKRVAKRYSIARGRLAKRPILFRLYGMSDEETLIDRLLHIRPVIDTLVKPYQGKLEKSGFLQWFPQFREELRREIENKQKSKNIESAASADSI